MGCSDGYGESTHPARPAKPSNAMRASMDSFECPGLPLWIAHRIARGLQIASSTKSQFGAPGKTGPAVIALWVSRRPLLRSLHEADLKKRHFYLAENTIFLFGIYKWPPRAVLHPFRGALLREKDFLRVVDVSTGCMDLHRGECWTALP